MSKSLLSFAAIALLVVGCVSVGPSTTAGPTATAAGPTAGVATPAPATPQATSTTSATTEPAPTDSPEPTDEPEPTDSPEPTESPEETAEITPDPSSDPGGLGRDLLFADEFDDPTSGWDELDEAIASVGYDSGALHFRFNETGWAYTVRDLDQPVTVLRAAGQFIPDSDGIFGTLCGNSDGNYIGAVIGTDGNWVTLRIDVTGVTVLTRDDDAGLTVPVGDITSYGVQCTINDDGSVTIEAVIPNAGPFTVHTEPAAGFTAFDVMGIYAEATQPEFNLAVDTAAALGVEPDGNMSAGATELLAHIPVDLQAGCAESPVPPLFVEPASFVVTCVRQTEGDGSELADYVQFPSIETLNDAYQERVDAFGVPSEGSCQTAANETTWTFNDVSLGRVQCAPQGVGIRFDWTDETLNILATLVDLEGDYAAVYEDWLEAGPNE